MSEKVQGHVGIAQIDGAALTLGQKLAAESIPVVLPSDGTLPLGTGAATAAKQDEQTTLLTNIAGYVDGLEGFVDGLETSLTAISGYVDGLEASLTTIVGHVDGLEGLLTTLGGYVDGLEGLLTGVATAANQATVITSLQLIDDVIYTDDAAFTPGTSKIAGIGLQADETGTDSVDEGDVGCPRMTLDRKTITSPQPHTAGGCSAAAFLSDGSTKAGVIKNAAGQIYGLSVGNANAAACYVRLYNMTTNPATTDTPVYRFLIPGGSAGAGREKTWPLGMAFSTGIAYRITTGAADNNDTAAASAEVTANFDYK